MPEISKMDSFMDLEYIMVLNTTLSIKVNSSAMCITDKENTIGMTALIMKGNISKE
jgi:hypothetical protein